MTYLISLLLLITGAGVGIIWFVDLKSNSATDPRPPLFKTRTEPESTILGIHVLAEMIMGGLLIISGIITILQMYSLYWLVNFSCGLLFYSSLNSLSWSLATPDRIRYVPPMLVGLLLSLLTIYLLNY